MERLFSLDILIVLFYLTLVMSLGFYAARFTSEGSQRYFFADRSLTWFFAALSLFATSFTGNQILGIIGMSTTEILIPGQLGAIAAFSLLLLGWFFAPSFIRLKVSTAPEYLEKKFDKQSRTFFAAFSIIFYALVRLSITVIAAGIILSKLLSIDPFTASQIIVILTGIYVIIGGFSAVAYTQIVQSFFIILSLIAITLLGVYKVGDLGIIWTKLTTASNAMIQPLIHSEWNVLVSFIGGLIIGVWFWCTDQFVIQRVVSIKDENHARSAAVLAGFLHIFIIVLLIVISICTGVLYLNRGIYLTISKIIIEMNMVSGLNGLILSGALALLMASLASLFSSAATIFTFDFSRRNFTKRTERRLLLKGRLVTLAIVIFSILWIPVIRLTPESVLIFMVKIPVFCAPVITAVFIFARRTPGKLPFSAAPVMIFGTLTGLVCAFASQYDISFLWDISILTDFNKVPFTYFVILLFGVSYLVLLIQNRMEAQTTPEKNKDFFNKVAIKELLSVIKSQINRNSINTALSVILVILVFSMWWVFKI